MGWIHYLRITPAAREQIANGEDPIWLRNSKRSKYIRQVMLSAPPWVDREALWAMMDEARRLTELTGTLHVLDHKVPLTHPRVCGLTVPWNVRVVPWRVNASKGNRWDPDQMSLFAEE